MENLTWLVASETTKKGERKGIHIICIYLCGEWQNSIKIPRNESNWKICHRNKNVNCKCWKIAENYSHSKRTNWLTSTLAMAFGLSSSRTYASCIFIGRPGHKFSPPNPLKFVHLLVGLSIIDKHKTHARVQNAHPLNRRTTWNPYA